MRFVNSFFFSICCFLSCSLVEAKPPLDEPWDFAIVAIFQNEAPYLKEWIEFHKLVGADHFYLYNHLSTDHYMEILQPYIESKEVELIDWAYEYQNHYEWVRIQSSAYEDCIRKAAGKVKWLAILDVDEFLFNPQGKIIPNYLKPLETASYQFVGGVIVHWHLFGTSYVNKIPDNQLLIETMLLTSGQSNHPIHVKTICRPERVKHMINPHLCAYHPGYKQFNKAFEKLGPIRINHYWTRDEDFFYHEKILRRKKWDLFSIEQTLEWANSMNRFPDTAIQIYVPMLREKIGLSSSEN